MSDEYERDPAWQEAYSHTFEGQMSQLNSAFLDLGRALSDALLPFWALLVEIHEQHVQDVVDRSWIRRWWHTVVGHRR